MASADVLSFYKKTQNKRNFNVKLYKNGVKFG